MGCLNFSGAGYKLNIIIKKEIITAKLDIKKAIVEFNPDDDTNKPFRAEDIFSF